MAMTRGWHHPFFDDFYLRGYRDHLIEAARTAEDVALVDAIWRAEGARRATTRVLDLGCGYGRHAWGFASRGWRRVVGVDAEPRFLSAAAAAPRHAKSAPSPQWVEGRMEALPFEPCDFGAACCLFNTLGYLGAEQAWNDAHAGRLARPTPPTRDPQTAALRELARVLLPGAPIVLDLPDRRELLSLLREQPSLVTATEGCSMSEEYAWEPRAGVLRIRSRMAIRDEPGPGASKGRVRTRTADCHLRLYTPAEITRRLSIAGFEAIAFDHPAFSGQPEEMFDGRMIVVARRRAAL
jgi:SAM-dependent methyltransferase